MPYRVLLLSHRLKYNSMISAHCNLHLLDSSNSPASASQVAGIKDTCYNAWRIFVFLVEIGFHYFGQAGLKLLTSGDLPASASQSAGIAVSEFDIMNPIAGVEQLRSDLNGSTLVFINTMVSIRQHRPEDNGVGLEEMGELWKRLSTAAHQACALDQPVLPSALHTQSHHDQEEDLLEKKMGE
ncbi:hypothetical protein AAY473_016858 [Plecturocebus cupreus]